MFFCALLWNLHFVTSSLSKRRNFLLCLAAVQSPWYFFDAMQSFTLFSSYHMCYIMSSSVMSRFEVVLACFFHWRHINLAWYCTAVGKRSERKSVHDVQKKKRSYREEGSILCRWVYMLCLRLHICRVENAWRVNLCLNYYCIYMLSRALIIYASRAVSACHPAPHGVLPLLSCFACVYTRKCVQVISTLTMSPYELYY